MNILLEEVISDRYKISNEILDGLHQTSWSKHTRFFAFPLSPKKTDEIRYFVDAATSPYRHRVLSDEDKREVGGATGWEEVMQFWVFKEKQNSLMTAFTVLFASDLNTPYRSQIVEGDQKGLTGWTIHSVFYAYTSPGILYKIATLKNYYYIIKRQRYLLVTLNINVVLDALMRRDWSYLNTAIPEDIIANVDQMNPEECSNTCAEGLSDAKGCKLFTWKNVDGKKCWLFKTDNLAGTEEYGSYSGLPRKIGNKEFEH